jgi:hypothetical protein
MPAAFIALLAHLNAAVLYFIFPTHSNRYDGAGPGRRFFDGNPGLVGTVPSTISALTAVSLLYVPALGRNLVDSAHAFLREELDLASAGVQPTARWGLGFSPATTSQAPCRRRSLR